MAEDGKIEMTVTINPLVSPLLFDALSACRSPRARATKLKALAETALREQLLGTRPESAPTMRLTSAVSAVPISPSPQLESGVQVLRISEGTGDDDGLLHESLGNQFAAFFD